MSNISRFTLSIVIIFVLFATSDTICSKNAFSTEEKYVDKICLNQLTYEINPSDDSTINKEMPDENYGGDISLMVCPRPYTYPERSLMMCTVLRFDMSEIPEKSPVHSAKLYLYYQKNRYYDSADRVLSIFSINEYWSENNITWNMQPDNGSVPLSSAIVPKEVGQWMEWDVTSDVQKILNLQHENFGWIIKDEEIFHINIQTPITYFASKEAMNFNPKLIVEIDSTTPPNAPSISGEISGVINRHYEYIFTAIDLDGDFLYYWVAWGDSYPDTGWIGPYASGEKVILNKSWDTKGLYLIKAKVKDIYNVESEWTELEVNMPRTYVCNVSRFFERDHVLKQFFGLLYKIS